MEARRDETAPPLDVAELHARYSDGVFRYVLRRVGRREDAEDIVLEVFLASVSAWLEVKDKSLPFPWLLGVARRKIADAIRRKKVRREILVSELGTLEPQPELTVRPGANSGEMQRQILARQAVWEVLNTLKEEQREALLLQHVEGLTLAEIAVVMGRTPTAVHSLLQRSRAAYLRAAAALSGKRGAQ